MKPKQIFTSLLFASVFLGFTAFPVQAADDLSVNFFYGSTCPHCKRVEPLIEELRAKYPEVVFNSYEVYEDYANSVKLGSWFDSYEVPVNRRGVPVVFIDGGYLVGDTPILENLETAVQTLIAESAEAAPVAIEIAPSDTVVGETSNFDTVNGLVSPQPPDVIPEEPSVIATDQLSVESDEEVSVSAEAISWQGWYWWLIGFACFILLYGLYRFWLAKSICFCLTDRQKDYITVGVAVILLVAFFALAKTVSPEFLEQIGYSLPLPLFTFFIGLVDGFNPCNLFVLTFLLALLTSASHSRARIYVVGFAFILMVYAIYFLFMAAWLNIFKFIGFITPLRIALALIALVAGIINCKELLFFRKGITLMVQEKHKGPLVRRIEHMKEVIEKGALPVLITSSVALAAFASLVELPCTAGFPIIYTGILSAKSLAGFSYYSYLALYNLFYVFPLVVVILIFGQTLQGKKISQRQMQIIKFVGGLIMVLLGIILLVNPGMIGIAG